MFLLILFPFLFTQLLDTDIKPPISGFVLPASYFRLPTSNFRINDSIISGVYLKKIDSIAEDGINKKAYPGCQIFISKNGKVILNKSYGYHTYDKTEKVIKSDLYDIASVTKVAATTLCMMKLVDEKKILLDDRFSKYLPYLLNTNKETISIREVLAHQAGLKSWIPFYKSSEFGTKVELRASKVFRKYQSSEYSIRVADGIFMRNDYRDTIYKQIAKSEVTKDKKYLYSDLGFYLLADLIQRLTGKSLDEYADESFYKPMQLDRITFCPRDKFVVNEIIPTENDTVFRKQLISGYVHDPGAAMFGGVSGHAGLFSDAYDLGLLFQMLMQNGMYNGIQYISPETIKEFTKYQYPENNNRRGLGFDKPAFLETLHLHAGSQVQKASNCALSASKNSYGHSGFTGCFVWIDPDYQLIYVFLSNRIYPDANNHKITDMNIRTNIQQLIYDGLK